MTSMLVVLGTLSTPLAAQLETPPEAPPPVRNAIGFGFVATLGAGWQIEGGEVGFVRRYFKGPLGALSASARIGAFIDQGAILGGTKGVVFAGTLAARTSTISLAQLGDDISATQIGFDVTLEASGYAGSSSPMPEGSHWAALALLPGVRVGSGPGLRYALVVGPTVFLGNGKSNVRGLLGIRIEMPLARRESRP